MPLYRSARAGQWRSSGAHRRGRSGATLGAPAGVLPISRLARMAWRTCQRGPPPHEMTALARPEFWDAGARWTTRRRLPPARSPSMDRGKPFIRARPLPIPWPWRCTEDRNRPGLRRHRSRQRSSDARQCQAAMEVWGDMGGRRSEPEIEGLIFGSLADDGQRHIRRSPEHGDDAIGLAVGIEPAAIFDLKIQPQAAAFGHHLAAVGRAGQVHPDAGVVLDPVAVGALRRVYVQAETLAD